MIEYTTEEAGKATVIGSLDAITGIAGIVAPLIGGFIWQQISYAAPFHFSALVNAFACVPLVAIMRSRNRHRAMPHPCQLFDRLNT
jgi:MFS family permease